MSQENKSGDRQIELITKYTEVAEPMRTGYIPYSLQVGGDQI